MSTWLKLLPLEISEVDELVEPQEAIKDGEEIAGIISEDLRKLYTLWQSMEKSAEMLSVELRYRKGTDEERGKIAEMKYKSHALQMIFWIGVIDELGLWGHPQKCAMREGWQVVELQSGPPDILRYLFGFQP